MTIDVWLTVAEEIEIWAVYEEECFRRHSCGWDGIDLTKRYYMEKVTGKIGTRNVRC